MIIIPWNFQSKNLRIGRKALVIALSEAVGTFVSGILIAEYFLHYSLYNSYFWD
jgi:hypothetical protein